MKHAVETRIIDNGRIVAKVCPAKKGEASHLEENRACDVWVTVFDGNRIPPVLPGLQDGVERSGRMINLGVQLKADGLTETLDDLNRLIDLL